MEVLLLLKIYLKQGVRGNLGLKLLPFIRWVGLFHLIRCPFSVLPWNSADPSSMGFDFLRNNGSLINLLIISRYKLVLI